MAGGTVRRLITRWGFEIDDAPLDEMRDKLAGVKDAAERVAVGVAAAVAALVGLVSHVASAGNELQLMAQRTGSSVEALSTFQAAAELAGVSGEAFGGALDSLTEKLTELRYDPLGGTATMFNYLGIRARDAAGKILPVTDVLNNIIERIRRAPEAEQFGLALKLLGGQAKDLMPIIQAGGAEFARLQARAQELGAVMSGETAQASRELTLQWAEMRMVGRGLMQSVFQQVAPTVRDVVRDMLSWYDANRAFLQQGMGEVFRTIAWALNVLAKALMGAVAWTRDAVEAFGGWHAAMAAVKVALVAVTAGATALMALKLTAFLVAVTAQLTRMGGAAALAAGKWSLLSFAAIGAVQALKPANAEGDKGIAWVSAWGMQITLLIPAIWQFVTAVRAAGTAGLLAQLKFLAIPLAIAAAAAYLYLLLDDVMTYFHGGESAVGDMIAAMREWGGAGAWVAEKLDWILSGRMGEELYDAWEQLDGSWAGMKDAFVGFMDWLWEALSGLASRIGQWFVDIWANALKSMKDGLTEYIGPLASSLWEGVSTIPGAFAEAGSALASVPGQIWNAAPVSDAQTAAARYSSSSSTVMAPVQTGNVNVTVNGGSSPQATADAVTPNVQRALELHSEQVRRQAARAFTTTKVR